MRISKENFRSLITQTYTLAVDDRDMLIDALAKNSNFIEFEEEMNHPCPDDFAEREMELKIENYQTCPDDCCDGNTVGEKLKYILGENGNNQQSKFDKIKYLMALGFHGDEEKSKEDIKRIVDSLDLGFHG